MKEVSFRNDVLPLKNVLFRLALRITTNREEAEDVVQETLMRVWDKRAEWDAIDSMEAFALSVCRNLSIDFTKRKGRHDASLDDAGVSPQAADQHNPFEQADQSNRVRLVRQIIDTLPEKQRSCIQLRDFEGKSYKEVAEVMGISESQVKVNIFVRARPSKQNLNNWTNMDYKYIEQLLERYWRCETTLQEEEILRSFFSQEDVPVALLAYRDLFVAQREETKQEVLDESFDERMLAMVDEQKPVKPIVITMRQRLMPLFKAAAVVAIILTLGNAAQIAFEPTDGTSPEEVMAGYNKAHKGPSVAKADTTKTDSIGKDPLASSTMIR